MICLNYDHNKKFGLLKFHSGYGKFNLNSPKGYSLKIINAQTGQYIAKILTKKQLNIKTQLSKVEFLILKVLFLCKL